MSQHSRALKALKPTAQASRNSKQCSESFRIGKVHVYLRSKVWYVRYHERGRRIQQRASPDKSEARKIAAEVNAQLECNLPSAFGFEQIRLVDLREKWLDYHEDIRRSALSTINRYRSATAHLITFADANAIRFPSELTSSLVEDFVRHLRRTKVAPNGHESSEKRFLRDTGIKFILHTSSSLFNYAKRQRNLPPYCENPFVSLDVTHFSVEDTKPIVVFSATEERQLLESSDSWCFPIMLTLLQTGMRPQELVHLLLPEDLDLEQGWIHVSNKRQLGWLAKTRRERSIPIRPELVSVLSAAIAGRTSGPVFRQRRCEVNYRPPLEDWTRPQVEAELIRRWREQEVENPNVSPRVSKLKASQTIWRDLGAMKYDYLRNQFVRLMTQIGRPDITAVKTCRHNFATCLQDANVDPLIRNELLGHSPAGLGMTTRYTQTRPETKQKALLAALQDCESTKFAREQVNCWNST